MSIRTAAAELPRELGRAVLDLLFPPLCVGCDDRLPAGAVALPLCPSCRRSLSAAPETDLLERLGRLDSEAPFRAMLAMWTFDEGGVLQRLQHALKYGDRPSIGIHVGVELGRLWRRTGQPHPDAIVPIPVSRARLLERGYNQAERLASGIGAELGAPLADYLVRARSTRSQTSLSREKRRTNVAGAFGLGSETPDLKGRRILLVDDVLTTGATVVAAAEPLVASGAHVDLALLALTRE